MDYSNITLFNIMKSKLETLSERQSVLAQNIANADTPGYKAKDVVEPDFKALLRAGSASQTLRMTTTNPNHIGFGGATSGSVAVIKTQNASETNPNGNNVVIEDEMAKIAANQADYQKVLNLYSKAVSMFKTAIGNPNTSA